MTMRNGKIIISVAFALILVLLSFNLASGEDIYYPYPIIFVHGLNSSDQETWMQMRDGLREYFRYGETKQGGVPHIEQYKYPEHVSELNYFLGCDYPNNRDIATSASSNLKAKIQEALSYYPASVPESERKVIIVCHSMGGLVTRSLLRQDNSYKERIARVIFIDTPHLGSPYASALWLLNEIRNGNYSIDCDVIPFSESAFSPFAFNQYLFSVASEYTAVCSQLGHNQLNIRRLLKILDIFGPYPAGTAISQLRIPATTRYKAVYRGFGDIVTVTVRKDYDGNNTFLGQPTLEIPEDYKVIVGRNTPGLAYKMWLLNELVNFGDSFVFPTLAGEEQTVDKAIYPGDGIVTKSSQEGIGDADYTVDGFHVGIPDNCINEVLDALDDSPVIEDMYVAKWPASPAYVVVKVKDYLLADVEIVSMTVDGNAVDLSGFEYKTGHYKPYYKFGKDFLRQREATDVTDKKGNPITLAPGEFYIELDLDVNSSHIVNIKVKNASTNSPTERSLSIALIELVGSWAIDVDTGDWAGFSNETSAVAEILRCGVAYRGGYLWLTGPLPYNYYWTSSGGYPWGPPSGYRAAYLYKIKIPNGLDVDYVKMTLKRVSVSKYIYFVADVPFTVEPHCYPSDVTAVVRIDYAFNSLFGCTSPAGEYSLICDEIGGDVQYVYRKDDLVGYITKGLESCLPPDLLMKTIMVNGAIDTIWLSIYPANIQSMKAQVEPRAMDAFNDPNILCYFWQIANHAWYSIEDIYFHEEGK